MSFAIAIVEDDPQAADLLNQILSGEGYRVEIASSAADAKSLISRVKIDLVLLDINLAPLVAGKNADFITLIGDSLVGHEGFEVAAWLRDTHPDVRIIFLTSLDHVGERVRGLDLGGDDYITKPFHTAELKARIRSTLRRSMKQKSGTEVFNGWQLDITLQQLTHLHNDNMHPINLTAAENKILLELLDAQGKTVSRESLSKRAFGRPLTPHDRAVDTSVSKLRAKLNDGSKSENRVIETMHGFGYRIVRR